MFTLLLAVIYIGFVSLGVPDSLFGAAWPAVYRAFGLPVSYSSFFTFTMTSCTLTSSFFSAKLINRFGVGKIAAVSTAMTGLALLLASFAHSFWVLVAIAVPLGFGAGAIDAGLNNYVALHYKARQMNFLHCFYGIGISLTPYLLSFALRGGTWQDGYRAVSYVQLGISAIMIAALPLWAKASKREGALSGEAPVTLTIKQTVSIKGVPIMLAIFFFECALESTCVAWGTTYLAENRGLSADFAAGMTTFYFIGLALARFISGLISGKVSSKKLLIIGQVVLFLAATLMILPLKTEFAVAGLFLAGFGIGPLYPNLMHLTPRIFGVAPSQSIMGLQMSAASFGYLVTPISFSVIQQWLGMRIFPVFFAILLCLFVISFCFSDIKKSAH